MGRLDVDALWAELEGQEFNRWRAYDRLEPIGNERICEQLVLVGVAICQSLGADVKPDNLRLKNASNIKRTPKPASPAAIKANIWQFVALHNASVT